MKLYKLVILEALLLFILSCCGTITIKIFDMILDTGYENIILTGFKVGFLAWLMLLVGQIFIKRKNLKGVDHND